MGGATLIETNLFRNSIRFDTREPASDRCRTIPPARVLLLETDGQGTSRTGGIVRTPICDQLGIEFPLFAFSHCRDVVAAVSKAGGYGVLGALAFSPDQLEIELSWIDDNVDGKPYGVDFAMPEKFVGKGEEFDFASLEGLIPAEHRDFVEQVLAEYDVPPLPEGVEGVMKAAGLGVEVEGPGSGRGDAAAPGLDARQRARPAAGVRGRGRAREGRARRRALREPAARGAQHRARRRRADRPGHRSGRPLRRDLDDGARARSRRHRRLRTCPCSPPVGSAAAGRWRPRWRSARRARGPARSGSPSRSRPRSRGSSRTCSRPASATPSAPAR